jgi:lipopolysaccharide transport system ATP-binding protein
MGAIVVSNVGKAYRQYPSRWARLAEWLVPGHRARHRLHWILQNVTFRVEPGEAVGIIGINGAGKSTLLKMITGTTEATTGTIAVSGRVAAMLELGMGFHPDFTGRENAVMTGQLLGFSLEEMGRLMPEIEAFAEIGDYLDRPLRVYSSGMQMRLAFSVATARRPDVLIVDEALAVGDAYFQHKSFARIRAYRDQGTTLLIVSHDRAAIQSLCDRAILLEGGFVVRDGDPEEVLDFYNALIAEKEQRTVEVTRLRDGRAQTRSGTGEATVTDIRLVAECGARVERVRVGQPVSLRVEVKTHAPIERLIFGYGIRDRLGQVIFGINTELTAQPLVDVPAGATVVYEVGFRANLGSGSYSVQTALCSSDTHLIDNYEWRDLALVFEVVNVDKPVFVGSSWMDVEIRVNGP